MAAPLGLIAGKGKFPLLFAQEARNNGRELVVIALKEEVNEDFAPYARAIHSISVAKLDTIIQAPRLRPWGCSFYPRFSIV
jgi:DUF1009 family protein